GVLELLWPTGARRVARPRTAPAPTLSRLAAPARLSSARLVALVERARAETDPARRAAALRVTILTLEQWRASGASLDPAVVAALDRARAELWADYQRVAFRRLAPPTPWRPTLLRARDAGRLVPSAPGPIFPADADLARLGAVTGTEDPVLLHHVDEARGFRISQPHAPLQERDRPLALADDEVDGVPVEIVAIFRVAAFDAFGLGRQHDLLVHRGALRAQE